MFNTDLFHGQTALVTGGGSGIGLAIARRLSQSGAHTVLVGRREGTVLEAAAAICAEGGSAEGVACDVRDRERVEAVAAELAERQGFVQMLVNSAAGNFRSNPEDLSPNAWRSVVQIVLDGTWNWSQVLGRQAITTGQPLSILNIGTAAGKRGSATTVHSASAKAGVLTMTTSLAAAWGEHGIRVNALTPGVTSGTAGAAALYPDEESRDKHLSDIPLRRFGQLNEVAEAAAFLLSDHASYITGTNLMVDGGRAIGGL
ncbi:SDR family oxidoreductase [Pseudarthrobacter sp. NPDC058329]|uniref:SDR family oxidoreductase n=1 Tax=Pseudarthrobacter sp. NPDC058329 TaxID=3346448 RepID=UPI0036DD4133